MASDAQTSTPPHGKGQASDDRLVWRFPKPVSSDTPLRARERRFVEEYLVDLKGEAAAIRAPATTLRMHAPQASRLSTKARTRVETCRPSGSSADDAATACRLIAQLSREAHRSAAA